MTKTAAARCCNIAADSAGPETPLPTQNRPLLARTLEQALIPHHTHEPKS